MHDMEVIVARLDIMKTKFVDVFYNLLTLERSLTLLSVKKKTCEICFKMNSIEKDVIHVATHVRKPFQFIVSLNQEDEFA